MKQEIRNERFIQVLLLASLLTHAVPVLLLRISVQIALTISLSSLLFVNLVGRLKTLQIRAFFNRM